MSSNRPKMRFATYNVRKCVGLDRQRRPGRVLDVINGLNADVVAIQEADRRLGNRPTALPHDHIIRNTDFEPVDIAHNDVSLGWHGNAILLRKGSKVHTTRRIDLPGLEPRGAAMAEVEQNGATFRVIAVHLGLTRKMRRAQLAEITKQVKAGPEMETVILGDFNEWSPSSGIEPLQQDYDIHAPGRSFHAARPMAALDRIAVTPSLELLDAGVEETALAQRASDHLPVWADFRLPAKPTEK